MKDFLPDPLSAFPLGNASTTTYGSVTSLGFDYIYGVFDDLTNGNHYMLCRSYYNSEQTNYINVYNSSGSIMTSSRINKLSSGSNIGLGYFDGVYVVFSKDSSGYIYAMNTTSLSTLATINNFGTKISSSLKNSYMPIGSMIPAKIGSKYCVYVAFNEGMGSKFYLVYSSSPTFQSVGVVEISGANASQGNSMACYSHIVYTPNGYYLVLANLSDNNGCGIFKINESSPELLTKLLLFSGTTINDATVLDDVILISNGTTMCMYNTTTGRSGNISSILSCRTVSKLGDTFYALTQDLKLCTIVNSGTASYVKNKTSSSAIITGYSDFSPQHTFGVKNQTGIKAYVHNSNNVKIFMSNVNLFALPKADVGEGLSAWMKT